MRIYVYKCVHVCMVCASACVRKNMLVNWQSQGEVKYRHIRSAVIGNDKRSITKFVPSALQDISV